MQPGRIIGATLIAMIGASGMSLGDEPKAPSDADFAKLHALIRPQKGESRWMEIDWHPTIWEARQKAAAEGKPIFIMAGSGGAPCAGC